MDSAKIKRRDFLIATALTGAAAALVITDPDDAQAKDVPVNKSDLEDLAGTFADTSSLNRVSERDAYDESYVNMRIFERPIISVGAADDPRFIDMKKNGIVGDHFILPHEWLPGAASVIGVFSPFTERIRKSNALSAEYPSREWLHGRIEGQEYNKALSAIIRDAIIVGGARAVSPMLDARFAWCVTPNEHSEKSAEHSSDGLSLKNHYLYSEGAKANIPPLNSNWSERHVAYICGLGTFGRHTCIITRKGTAGRLTSIVTDLPLKPDVRGYKDRFDYCFQCGKCVERCPGEAIAMSGKDKNKCLAYVGKLMKYTSPRYGCGKCQTDVPCETAANITRKQS